MDSMGYLILAAAVVGIPGTYLGILKWNQPYFEQEKNRNRTLMKTKEELLVLIFSELAMLKLWYRYQTGTLSGLLFSLLYTNLIMMTVLCMTDAWEKIVPNRILLLGGVICLLETGFGAVKNIEIVTGMLPSMLLGFLFCLLSFGVSYLISRGSMGSGDVKLSLVLGVFLTGEYVVKTVFYGCLLSALYSLVQLLRKKLSRKDEIPFVPFLYIGMILTYLAG